MLENSSLAYLIAPKMNYQTDELYRWCLEWEPAMGLPLGFVLMLGSSVPSNITNVPIIPRRFTTKGGPETNPNYDLFKHVHYTPK